eukprot:CAMPEP_0177444148 /NCGR_PEP_ID=MMETSP0369-20130122/5842_1 /TAXON_ID=447022 ORGANISM="Scrippsiella hangoei-like, Strain SHHI-4" /NCGR_SAMPLE_ID=MMETSP0369 /ASSEMBLY_ACC=CAM_ASM_000364 /LENGTH=200 /DNA_ID=CAMNT_0018916179 /DNA_START=380 /DNA_END=984 /DNA_ORIENTATION=+
MQQAATSSFRSMKATEEKQHGRLLLHMGKIPLRDLQQAGLPRVHGEHAPALLLQDDGLEDLLGVHPILGPAIGQVLRVLRYLGPEIRGHFEVRGQQQLLPMSILLDDVMDKRMEVDGARPSHHPALQLSQVLLGQRHGRVPRREVVDMSMKPPSRRSNSVMTPPRTSSPNMFRGTANMGQQVNGKHSQPRMSKKPIETTT